MTMKALCIRQPFASLIASGTLITETRTWKTYYRGPLLIVASKSGAVPGLPAGQAIAIGNLSDCRNITEPDAQTAYCVKNPEAFAWIFLDIQPIQPFQNIPVLRTGGS